MSANKSKLTKMRLKTNQINQKERKLWLELQMREIITFDWAGSQEMIGNPNGLEWIMEFIRKLLIMAQNWLEFQSINSLLNFTQSI